MKRTAIISTFGRWRVLSIFDRKLHNSNTTKPVSTPSEELKYICTAKYRDWFYLLFANCRSNLSKLSATKRSSMLCFHCPSFSPCVNWGAVLKIWLPQLMTSTNHCIITCHKSGIHMRHKHIYIYSIRKFLFRAQRSINIEQLIKLSYCFQGGAILF